MLAYGISINYYTPTKKTVLKDNTTKDTLSCNDILKTKISKNNNIVISRSVTTKYALTLRIHPTYKQVYQ